MILINVVHDGSSDPSTGFYHVVVQDDSGKSVYVSGPQHNIVVNRVEGFGIETAFSTSTERQESIESLSPRSLIGSLTKKGRQVRRRRPMSAATKEKISKAMTKRWRAHRRNGRKNRMHLIA